MKHEPFDLTLGGGPGGGSGPGGQGRLGRHPNLAGVGMVAFVARPRWSADLVARSTRSGPLGDPGLRVCPHRGCAYCLSRRRSDELLPCGTERCTRASGEGKLVVRPLDECPVAYARAVPPGHDIHCVDPVVAIRAYFVTDGGVGGLLMDPF